MAAAAGHPTNHHHTDTVTTTTIAPHSRRIGRPECWGPLTPTDLLLLLAAEYNWECDASARRGMHPSAAALIAWQMLREDYRTGGPLRVSRLPFHARRITERLQLRTTTDGSGR